MRPVTRINEQSVDYIQKELLKYCKYLKPNYIPQSEPVYYEGKILLLVWCPEGYERPYQCPKQPISQEIEKAYYKIKQSRLIVN